ncbi:calmodulin-regulated spectrin-associated protein 2-like isoform X2 [Conger conger]|uniref:calmodulin-regulated spectrin-associated protein 2-like isoform X2 n=1 Tax=Conger conger TaxID=82655 RepID=UPI002A5ABF61|nr:calmodulin-regulated spectrin-associated protein 2-like isoform X2 [Conger conger]
MGDVTDGKEIKRAFIVPAIKAFDHYDFNRAKICCSLTWLVAKAFGTDNVPEELKEPFYTDQYSQEHIKPPVVNLLLSAELFCRAGSLILKSDAAKPLLGHDAVIQALAQKGLYVTDQERLVTERDLCKRPIKMSAHLAMIDTLMMAYTAEMVSLERVVSCLQKYRLDSEDDVPYDTEEAVTSWINKVNEYLKDIITQEQKMREPWSEETSGPRVRFRKEHALPRQVPCFPPVDNLLKDNTDGCALAALVHFYCPGAVQLEDICLKEIMSLADSLYNLQLIQEFCQENLNRCCHFTLEDMLYASSSIKNNYLVFMAELFWWFEVVKPSFVQPRVLNVKDPALQLTDVPTVPISNDTRESFINTPASPNQPSLSLRPQPKTSSSGVIKRSTSMSYMDGCVGTWPKEKRSSAHGISFDIPFDRDDMARPTVGRGMSRSASTDGLGHRFTHAPRNMRRNLSFQPVNGQSGRGIEEEVGRQPGFSNGLALEEDGPSGAAPSIEEALKIIHSPERPGGSLAADQADNGFFLHGQDSEDAVGAKGQAGDDQDSASTEMDTGIHVRTEDIQDEDSSLRDYTASMDSDADHEYDPGLTGHQAHDGSSPAPSSLSGPSRAGSSASSGSGGIRMTSFAEQKFRKLNHHHPHGESRGSGPGSVKTTPENSELNIPHSVAWAPMPEERSPVRATSLPPSPRDPTQLLASEMLQLKMKLEEKRRAIEAQKKKVEAAFTRHRQRMGRTAFLNVVRKKPGGASPLREEAAGSETGRPPASPDGDAQSHRAAEEDGEEESARLGQGKQEVPDGAEQGHRGWTRSPGEEGVTGEADLAEYTRSIERLNTSLSFLQTEMQRLAQQQEVIMQMREQQSWAASPTAGPTPSPQRQVRELRGSVTRSTGSLSPVLSSTGSPRPSHRSPTTIKRKSASFHSRTPRTPRPSDLKITPFSRMLNTPQSVDSLPRLRRFSPSQTQLSSFAYFGHDEPTSSPTSAPTHTPPPDPAPEPEEQDGPTEFKADQPNPQTSVGPAPSPARGMWGVERDTWAQGPSKPKVPTVSEVLTQPVAEAVRVTPVKHDHTLNTSSRNLIEVPLSVLKPLEAQTMGNICSSSGEGDPVAEILSRDQKICCGFFFKDDLQGEEDIALKRAALLEKRLRREREAQQKKQELEAELEQKKELARLKAEEEREKKEDEKLRREFIKQEYLRRKQLKLMEDMDSVIKPRPASSKQKKPRPKSMHRDSVESPRIPPRAAGTRPRVFSVSSLSLASLNLGDNDSVNSDRRTPRPDSADGFLSPCLLGSGNGEKDWENGSTTSSVASNTEYTGPKLYKEPSAKSNKHIIQNALTHCCLAGKVNEGQKNRILEEIDKSEANNFLILFRDAACQFRSIYTYYPETEEITKLAGIGPKSITRKMIESLYKYNSDRKQFSHIPAKTMSASVDAITIFGHLWQIKKPCTPKKH